MVFAISINFYVRKIPRHVNDSHDLDLVENEAIKQPIAVNKNLANPGAGIFRSRDIPEQNALGPAVA